MAATHGRLLLSLAITVLLGAGTIGCDREADPEEFVDDLRLVLVPPSAPPGGSLQFFVEGEPPFKFEARRYVDLLTADGAPLYRLPTDGGRTLEFPLPPEYAPPVAGVALQDRQAVEVPADLDPGRYLLRGSIVGADGAERGTPTGNLQVEPPPRQFRIERSRLKPSTPCEEVLDAPSSHVATYLALRGRLNNAQRAVRQAKWVIDGCRDSDLTLKAAAALAAGD